MQFHTIKPHTKRTTSRRIARGGVRGKTAGRGHKGQKSRAGAKMRPEMRDLIKKLPKRRGETINRTAQRTMKKDVMPINLDVLAKVFTKAGIVSRETLLETGVISKKRGKNPLVKILGRGDIAVALTLQRLVVSAQAQKKIEAAGGSVS